VGTVTPASNTVELIAANLARHRPDAAAYRVQ